MRHPDDRQDVQRGPKRKRLHHRLRHRRGERARAESKAHQTHNLIRHFISIMSVLSPPLTWVLFLFCTYQQRYGEPPDGGSNPDGGAPIRGSKTVGGVRARRSWPNSSVRRWLGIPSSERLGSRPKSWLRRVPGRSSPKVHWQPRRRTSRRRGWSIRHAATFADTLGWCAPGSTCITPRLKKANPGDG